MTFDVHALDEFVLVGSAVTLLAILAVRVSTRAGLPSLLIYLLMGVALGEAGLGIGFEDRVEPFAKPVNYDAFRSFSPTGQVPALLHEGRTIYDSLGITLYLADRHDGVWPADPDARAWAQCTVAEMHSGFAALRNDCTMNVAFFAPVAFRIRTYGLDVGAGQAWVDHMLAHPAMREWERQALTEEWREESHEAELAAAGVITADYRHG